MMIHDSELVPRTACVKVALVSFSLTLCLGLSQGFCNELCQVPPVSGV